MVQDFNNYDDMVSSRSELPANSVKSGTFASLTSDVTHVGVFKLVRDGKAFVPVFRRLMWEKDGITHYSDGAIFDNCRPQAVRESEETQGVDGIFAAIPDEFAELCSNAKNHKKSVQLDVSEYKGKYFPKFGGLL